MKKKILLTGVCGFIGFHTAEKFLHNDYHVIGIDDMNDHYDPAMKRRRLAYLKSKYPDKFTYQRIDIRKRTAVEKLFQAHQFECIINLAARAGVRNSILDPQLYYETNCLAVINILEAMKKHCKDAPLLQASSSSVYGGNKPPFSEKDKCDTPLSPYAASKKACEELCYSYHYLFNMNILLFRFFSVYGKYGRPDMSIFRFIRWIDDETPLELFGDGRQERGFTYIDDITRALYDAKALNGYRIINLGNDQPDAMNTIIKMIETFLQKKADIKYLDRHPADIIKANADIAEAKRLLDWEPRVRIREGLTEVLQWYTKEKKWVKKIKLN